MHHPTGMNNEESNHRTAVDDISPATSESARNTPHVSYMNYFVVIGKVLDIDNLRNQLELIIKESVWKKFKLPDREDYEYNSSFCNKILTELHVDCKIMNRTSQAIWSRVMPLVKKEYQITRSTVTQVMKQNFNGIYDYNICNNAIFPFDYLKYFSLYTNNRYVRNG